jgi:hypothetical protein
MNVNLIVSATAVLIGLLVSLVYYLRVNSDDATYLLRSKWSVTTASGTDQTWWIDSESGAIKIQSFRDGETTTEEWLGGKRYTYFAVAATTFDADAFCSTIDNYDGDCADLAAEQASDLEAMFPSWTQAKGACVVTDDEYAVNTATLQSDGNLNVGGFTITMVGGSPTAITGNDGKIFATINSFENVEGEIDITGCDAGDEGDRRRATILAGVTAIGDSRRRLGEVSEERLKARNYLNTMHLEMVHPDDRDEAARQLDLTAIMATMSNTNWCGSGTDTKNTPCPVNGNGLDYEGDIACMRHDHGRKSETIWWTGDVAVRLGCDIDNGLATGTSNWAAQTIFGSWGIAVSQPIESK